MSDDMPGWNGTRRPDGVEVLVCPVPTADGGETWVIEGPGRFPILHCPHCGSFMSSKRQAQLVADALFPPAGVATT